MKTDIMNKGTLEVRNASDWHFMNCTASEWNADSPKDLAKLADPYGRNFAFSRQLSYGDVRVRFEFLLTPHSDAGIILRARDESHFYLIHFPNCGQGCRAQHFWTAFSKMDDTGYTKQIKLEMVRRVPSNGRIWLSADITLKGNKITARIGDNGYFEATDDTYPGPGHIGIYYAGGAMIRNVVVEGEEVSSQWSENITARQNWFYPCTNTQLGQFQQPIDLLKLPSGRLLLTFKAGEDFGKGKIHTIRSNDAGRTWSEPEPLVIPSQEDGWSPARLNVTPKGRLIAFIPTEAECMTTESTDEGLTWSEPVPLDLGPLPDKMKTLHMGPQAFVNLADGGMLLLRYGGHVLKDPDLGVGNWGALHCQAYTSRSTDDGRTWSEPVNVDNSAGLGVEGQCGNLDLTEVCAAEMGDGRIMALIRPIFSPWMWETWSADGGVTWGPCVRGPFPGYATPNMLRTSSGKVFVAHRLPNMSVNFSPDDGRTWDYGAQIDDKTWTMGSMVEVEPDVVLYVYYGLDRMRAQFFRATPDGLVPEYTEVSDG